MGRSPVPVASLSTSAKRKPLSLKPDRKSTPKKASSKFVVFGDKENQPANNGNQMSDVSQVLKKIDVVSNAQEEESAERVALRKRVEEAVAFHLANRSPPGTPSAARVVNDTNEESTSDTVKSDDVCKDLAVEVEGEVDIQVPPSKSTRSQTARLVLAVLVVLAMAAWSGIRVALLQPDNALVRYQPLVRQSVDFFVSAMTARPVVAYSDEPFIVLDMTTTQSDAVKIGSDFQSTEDDSTCDTVSAAIQPVAEPVTEEEAHEDDEDKVAAVEEAAAEDAAAEDAAAEDAAVEDASELVLQIEAPVGRTQLVLRKAFDMWTPLKKVFAKVQDKLVQVLHGISRFFQRKTM